VTTSLKEGEKFVPKTPPTPDLFWIGNLEFRLKNDFVLAASAMPEFEGQDEIIIPDKEAPNLWRGWVVSVGPGIYLPKAPFYFNPGIEVSDYIYFQPQDGRFFYFDNISFVFVKMKDVLIVAQP